VVAAAAAEAVETARLVEAGPELVAMLSSESKAEEVVGAALSAIAALKLEEAREEVRRLALEGPVATRRAAVRALEALGETSLPDTPAWEPGPYSGERLPERPYVRLTTSRGAIRVLLYARDSPLTVRNFAGLVRKGFYNGLKFHRVVPDFVAQGGDPRGDGFGGPGYSIRCEVNDRRFVAGSLGMALSGKDTGGSQFFFTVSPQPHLDGRHTNFGEIVEGFEVAMALIEGDRIIDAVVEGDRLPLDGRAGEGYTSAVQR
jgi:cyclophilin family peptidyl-prolyl cis-trans isomerase